MKPYPVVLFRTTDKTEAQRSWIRAHFVTSDHKGFSQWRSNVALRKVGKYWLVLLRDYSTVHPGSKKWRRSMRRRQITDRGSDE